MSRHLDPTDEQLEKWTTEQHAYLLRQLTDEDCKWDADSLPDNPPDED